MLSFLNVMLLLFWAVFTALKLKKKNMEDIQYTTYMLIQYSNNL